MNKKLLFLPIVVLFLTLSVQFTMADVLIEDSDFNSRTDDNVAFGQGTIGTGTGQAGNFVIFSCGVPNDLTNVFNNPTPGTWDELDQGPCGGGGTLCRQGIWAGFVDDPNSEVITCSWTEFGTVFASGSMRFSGMDESNPIIGLDCDTGQGIEAIAPSINTEAGSQVLRVLTLSPLTVSPITNVTDPSTAARAETEDFWGVSAISQSQTVTNLGSSELEPEAGPTGTFSVFTPVPNEWRACTIALRMVNVERAVPTMSEWGLIGFAAFAGIAGVWYLRRRQATA